MDNMTVVVIEGLSYDAMYQEVKYKNKKVMFKMIMLSDEFYDFKQLEASTLAGTEGKWFLTSDKYQYNKVTEFINHVLPELYEQIDADLKLPDYETPFRKVPKTTKMHCSYAEALKGFAEAGNPQDEEESQYNKLSEKFCKRRVIAVMMENFPDLADEAEVMKAEEMIKNAKRATAGELKKAQE
eukprot:15365477-Ditylum_brightwellii.AAC.1